MYNIPRNSSKAIKDIEIGGYVYSYDVESNTRELKKVTAVFVSEKDELYRLETSEGTVIDTTEGHPFYVEGKGWTVAAELKPDDILTTADGKRVEVESVTVIKLTIPVMVYNLEIEENHTYYVSADEVLVHNICDTDDNGGKKNKGAKGNNEAISTLSNKAVKHSMNDHMPRRYANQLKYMSKESAEKYLSYKNFFNKNWTDEQVIAALNYGYKEALSNGVKTGKYVFEYLGECVTVCL